MSDIIREVQVECKPILSHQALISRLHHITILKRVIGYDNGNITVMKHDVKSLHHLLINVGLNTTSDCWRKNSEVYRRDRDKYDACEQNSIFAFRNHSNNVFSYNGKIN